MRLSPALRSFLYYFGLWALACGLVLALLTGTLSDLSIPIGFGSDGLFYHALSSVVANEGWWFHSHHLGFPFGAPFISFPSNSNVDFAFVWFIELFVHDAPTAINLAWIGLLAAGGTGCAACMRMLGISRLLSLILGLLYATMPYAIYRNIGQFSLTPYLIVYPATVALLAFGGGWQKLSHGQRCVLLIGCVLLGLNYIYYAFFGCMILLMAYVAGLSRFGKSAWFKPAGLAIGLVLAATALNLAPSLIEWVTHGDSPNVRAKMPQEFDYYGLKLRHLLTPLWEHSFPPFRSWLARDFDADFPLETENSTARLGLVGSIGFVILLLAPLFTKNAWSKAQKSVGIAMTVLCTGLLLYAVVGGLGSIFNLLVAPEIRAANRVTPYLYFFSLVSVGLQIERLNLVGAPPSRFCKLAYRGTAVILLGLGVYDQSHAFIGLKRNTNNQKADTQEIRSFVSKIESATRGTARIFQLPFTEFLNDNGRYRMGPYDHFRPVIFSKQLYWSYPSMSHQSQVWTAYARTLTPAQLISFLRASGFTNLWFDRFGYADSTDETAFSSSLGPPKFESPSHRYAVFDLNSSSQPPSDPQMVTAARQFLNADLRLRFVAGFYNAEAFEGGILRWSKRESTVKISNQGTQLLKVEFRAYFSSLVPGPVKLRIESNGQTNQVLLTNKRTIQAIPLSLAPGSTATIKFYQIDESFALPNDRRQLYFGIFDPYFVILN